MFGTRFSFVGFWICGAALAASDGTISDATPQQQCRRKCVAQQNEFVARCVEAGGSQRECEMGGQRFLEECLHRCVPESDCRRQCQQRAKRFYRECRYNGGTEDACAQAAREFLQKCVEEHCVITCEEKCAVQARQGYNQCIEDGGSEADCRARAEHFHATCTEHCSPDCEDRCAALGHTAFNRCIEAGGMQEECAPLGRRVVAECIETNCDHDCGGIMGLPCPKGEFCLFPPGECNIADNMGVCRIIPGACPLVYEPVCGCDGETYGNACEAAAAQISIDHPGPCAISCGGIIGTPCPNGQFCQFPPGECDIADNQGRCRPTPTVCPDVYHAVCGCDGETYGNACEAAVTGVSIDHDGACAE